MVINIPLEPKTTNGYQIEQHYLQQLSTANEKLTQMHKWTMSSETVLL